VVRRRSMFAARRGYIFRTGNSLACGAEYHGFGKINVCRRNTIAQAELSGGSGLGSPRKLFPQITGSTAITEPQL
jgi:hypothetical protein